LSTRKACGASSASTAATETRPGSRGGATLIEALVAILILAILAVAGAALFASAHASLSWQAQRRTAAELANARLESVRASPYDAVKPLAGAATTYLSGMPGAWTRTAGAPAETVAVGGRGYGITTRVDFLDVDGATPATDCLLLTVTVVPPGGRAPVTLTTVCAQLDNR
jgi:type II secretory pathway pseudopilin PulG